jgi:pyrroline-5-carboxylate reductase
MSQACIAFIGAGKLTSCLVESISKMNIKKDKIWICNRSPDKLINFEKKYNFKTETDNKIAAEKADIIILGVKPHQISNVADDIKDIVKKRQPLIISLAAGMKLDTLAEQFGDKTAIIRAMPNTPVAVAAGVTGFVANKNVSDTQKQRAEDLFKNSGHTVWAENETQLDQIAALSGSGPAYFFAIIEALTAAATKIGLPQDIAAKLSLQTAYGAAKMAVTSDESVSRLRENVTSPGGMTEQALKELAAAKLNDTFEKVLKAGITQAEKMAGD